MCQTSNNITVIEIYDFPIIPFLDAMINVTEGIVGLVQMCHLTNCHANVVLKLPFHQYNVELSLRNAIEHVLEITSVLIL